MTLTDRLHKLNDQRNTLIDRYARKSRAHKNAAADHRDLVRATCKVLKFERKAEKAK